MDSVILRQFVIAVTEFKIGTVLESVRGYRYKFIDMKFANEKVDHDPAGKPKGSLHTAISISRLPLSGDKQQARDE